jgi:hypothetical protein
MGCAGLRAGAASGERRAESECSAINSPRNARATRFTPSAREDIASDCMYYVKQVSAGRLGQWQREQRG